MLSKRNNVIEHLTSALFVVLFFISLSAFSNKSVSSFHNDSKQSLNSGIHEQILLVKPAENFLPAQELPVCSITLILFHSRFTNFSLLAQFKRELFQYNLPDSEAGAFYRFFYHYHSSSSEEPDHLS